MTTMLAFFFTVLPAVSAQISIGPLQKNDSVYMLALLPLSGRILGSDPGALCRESMQIVIDSANANQNVLPNHRIDVVYGDDQCRAHVGLKEFFRLVGLDRPASAVLLGSQCSGVCQTVGRLPHLWSMIEIAAGCSWPAISPGPHYYSFHRVATPPHVAAAARLWFIKKMGWNKVAIFSDIDKLSSTDTTNFVTAAPMEGISVTAVEFHVGSMADTVANLKRQSPRVILVNGRTSTKGMFFCEAYKAGLYGEMITFVLTGQIRFIPGRLPRGCTWQQFMSVMDGAFEVIPLNDPLDGNMTTALNYTSRQFDTELHKRTGYDEVNVFWRVRVNCHDAALFGVHVLHEAEIGMRQANRSLSSFSSKDPDVLPVVMDAARRVNVTGLRGMLNLRPMYTQEILAPVEVFQIQGNETVRLFLYYPNGEREPEKFDDVRWTKANP